MDTTDRYKNLHKNDIIDIIVEMAKSREQITTRELRNINIGEISTDTIKKLKELNLELINNIINLDYTRAVHFMRDGTKGHIAPSSDEIKSILKGEISPDVVVLDDSKSSANQNMLLVFFKSTEKDIYNKIVIWLNYKSRGEYFNSIRTATKVQKSDLYGYTKNRRFKTIKQPKE